MNAAKFILLLAAATFMVTFVSVTFVSSAQAATGELTGAGSTFIYPVLAKWADLYKKETGIAVNYQSIGSGGGIKQIENKTVDFGATDMPLTSEVLAKNDLLQFPVINGAEVLVVHLNGIAAGQLKLTGKIAADIYLGTVKKWNDPAIAKINPGLKLPDQEISVIHRADGSGTTFIFTNYLSKISPEWKSKVGAGTAVTWATGVGAKGNEGVASYVKQIEGSIGYVEYAYAIQNKMTYTQIANRAGQFVLPTDKNFEAAAAGAKWAKSKNFNLIMTDAPGKNSWPIIGSTFVLMHKTPDKPEQTKKTLQFFAWAYHNGASAAKELHYVPLPKNVVTLIQKTWKGIKH